MRILGLHENPEVVESTARLLNGPLPLPDRYWLPVFGSGWESLHGTQNPKVFRGFVRELVSEWIRCGKRLMPEKTHVCGFSTGSEDYRWSDWKIYLAPEGTLVPDEVDLAEIDQSDPATHTWLWGVYWDWTHRIKPNIWFRHDGQLYLTYTSPAYWLPPKSIKLPPFIERDSPYLTVWDESMFWFVLFLNCGHAERLDRCIYCKRYFCRKRNPKKNVVLKRGPHCGKCNAAASIDRTEDTRGRRTGDMVKYAADVWEQWKPNSLQGSRSSWVANQVNQRTESIGAKAGKQKQSYYPAITSRWVTGHQTKIETEIERRKHATRKS